MSIVLREKSNRFVYLLFVCGGCGFVCLLSVRSFVCLFVCFCFCFVFLVTLDDFRVKKNRKIGRGNLYLTENRMSRNKIRCAADIYSHTITVMCYLYVPKDFSVRTFIKQYLTKYQFS